MSTITITITGAKEASAAFKKLGSDARNATKPLTDSSKMYLNAISANFTDEGTTFGEAWPPLSKATIAIKRRLYAQGKSIGIKKPLLRTGKLRKSFTFSLRGQKQSTIFNSTEYAMIHQKGGKVEYPEGSGKMRNVPQRVLAAVDDKRVQNVGSIFTKWIYTLLKKHKL